eukprot:g40775.t1
MEVLEHKPSYYCQDGVMAHSLCSVQYLQLFIGITWKLLKIGICDAGNIRRKFHVARVKVEDGLQTICHCVTTSAGFVQPVVQDMSRYGDCIAWVSLSAIKLYTAEAENEVLFLRVVSGVILTLEDTLGGHVTQELGQGVKMVGKRKVLSIIAYRAQVLCKSVTESTFDLTDVEEDTSEAMDTVDWVGGCIGEPLSDLESLSRSLDG